MQNRKALVIGAVAAAVAIAAALILVSVLGSSGGGKKASTETTTTSSTTAAADTAALLNGIPQKLNGLGNPKAPVTMVEFADLQCPFCREYALNALPAILDEYVRPGKVRLIFAGLAFLGPDSEKALRAVYAAGLQNRLWNYVDLLYRDQGAENSGWVTETLLRSVAASIPGIDVAKLLRDRGGTEVDNGILGVNQQATSAHVNSTPSFFAGPTGGTLQRMNISKLEPGAFRPTLDKLLK